MGKLIASPHDLPQHSSELEWPTAAPAGNKFRERLLVGARNFPVPPGDARISTGMYRTRERHRTQRKCRRELEDRTAEGEWGRFGVRDWYGV